MSHFYISKLIILRNKFSQRTVCNRTSI